MALAGQLQQALQDMLSGLHMILQSGQISEGDAQPEVTRTGATSCLPQTYQKHLDQLPLTIVSV